MRVSFLRFVGSFLDYAAGFLGSSFYAIMDLSMTALSLSQGETEFLSLEGVDDVGGEETFELSLVGRFLTNRSINFNFMWDHLSHL